MNPFGKYLTFKTIKVFTNSNIYLYQHVNSFAFHSRYLTDVLNMLQPLYIFIIFVLKRNVIDVIKGKDKKKRPTKSKQTSKTKTNIIKSKHHRLKDQEATNQSNPAFSISFDKDTEVTSVVPESNVVLLSAGPYEEIPLTIPSSNKNTGNTPNDRLI